MALFPPSSGDQQSSWRCPRVTTNEGSRDEPFASAAPMRVSICCRLVSALLPVGLILPS
jgi:hypothetical protein